MLYDLIIIGAGPAGLTASIYASYHKLNHLVIGDIIGGTPIEAAMIKNWPGVKQTSGIELMRNFRDHAEGLGAVIIQGRVVGLKKEEKCFEINVDNQYYHSKTLLLAMGTKRRRLNIPGEDKFLGKGVSYCATCDAIFFKNKIVAIVGGSDSAAAAANLLAEHASKVYVIYRNSELRCQPAYLEQIKKNPKITVIYNANVLEVHGDKKAESVFLDRPFEESQLLKTDGVFVEIGAMPSTDLLNEIGVKLNPQGYVAVDEWGKTNVSGVYAAGDITTNTMGFNQIVAAAADGATAVNAIYRYLKEIKKT